MKRKSIVQERGVVAFPAHTGERVYMTPFFKSQGLPDHLHRWQPVVDSMLEGVDTAGPIYLMVDQALVRAGNPHRRPGVHIDGHWIPAIQAHGGFGGGHGMPEPSMPSTPSPGSHGFEPTPPRMKVPKPRPDKVNPLGMPVHIHIDDSKTRFVDPPHQQDPRDIPGTEPEIMFAEEGLILASSVIGCRAYDGIWHGEPGEGGDCSHIDLSNLSPVLMLPAQVYAGNVNMLHESLPMGADCLRTVVRLNVPGWAP